MNQITPPPKLDIIPASAPFSDAQRSWLNGFFAGLLTPDGGPTPLSAEQGASMLGGGDGDDGEAPWHDQTMPIADRMKLAEGRPLRRGPPGPCPDLRTAPSASGRFPCRRERRD